MTAEILIVDDEPDICELVAGILQDEGYATRTARDADSALNAINADLAVGDTAFAPSGASLALNNTASNQDGCKNVTVNLAYAAS